MKIPPIIPVYKPIERKQGAVNAPATKTLEQHYAHMAQVM